MSSATLETLENECYDGIIAFYTKCHPADESTEIWKGLKYTELMRLYRQDPEKVREIIRNSLILILNLFSERPLAPRGADLEELPPDDLEFVLTELQNMVSGE